MLGYCILISYLGLARDHQYPVSSKHANEPYTLRGKFISAKEMPHVLADWHDSAPAREYAPHR